MLKTSITFVKQSNLTPMNNLTPLQEITSRIYAALVTASTYTETDGTVRPEYSTEKLLNYAITEAKALFEATKPEPLEVKPLEWKEVDYRNYSKGGEFFINLRAGKFRLCDNAKSTLEEWEVIGIFPTLDEAKQFAEFIRTR